MTVSLLKFALSTGAVAATLTASPALAASWERTVTVSGPNGGTMTISTERSCDQGECTVTWERTGPRGRTTDGSRTYHRPPRHR